MTYQKKVKLLCIPFAGGMSYTYLVWKKYLPENIELVPIELAGRGKRYKDDLIYNMNDMVSDIFEHIKDTISENEYVLFGHSMGSTIAYELAKRIKKNGYKEPLHIIYAGRLAPHLNNYYKKVSDNTDNCFFEEVYKLGGTPKEVYDVKELRAMYIPVLKADFFLLEHHRCCDRIKPFDGNISIFYADKDENTMSPALEEWRKYTNKECNFYMFSGEHFFIKYQPENVVNKIVNIIMQCC